MRRGGTQMCTMTTEQQNELLGGDTALIKVQATKTFEYCAREAAQIFGGASYVRGGQGEKVERLYREVRAYAIPGTSTGLTAAPWDWDQGVASLEAYKIFRTVPRRRLAPCIPAQCRCEG